MKKLVMLVLLGCSSCGVVVKPSRSYFGPPHPAKVLKVSTFDFGCSSMFCSTQISVWVQLFNDKPYPRGMTVECEYEVSKRRAIHHTTHTYKIPADASRTLIIPRVLMVEKPQYGTGLCPLPPPRPRWNRTLEQVQDV